MVFVERGAVTITSHAGVKPMLLERIEAGCGAGSFFNQLKLFWAESPADCEFRWARPAVNYCTPAI